MALLNLDLPDTAAILMSLAKAEYKISVRSKHISVSVRNFKLKQESSGLFAVNARVSFADPQVFADHINVKYKVHALMGMPLGNRTFSMILKAFGAQKKYGLTTLGDTLTLNITQLKQRGTIPPDF